MTVSIFIPDLPEFSPIIDGARKAGHEVASPLEGYWRIDADQEIRFDRKALGLRVALWNSALAGGFVGKIAAYDRNTMRIVSET